MRVRIVTNNEYIVENVDSVKMINDYLFIHSFMLPTYDECMNKIPLADIKEFEVIDGK